MIRLVNGKTETGRVLTLVTLAFLGLAGAFYLDLWGHPVLGPPIPLVDTNFISTATARLSVGEPISSGGDTSSLDCYGCHEKNKPLKLKLDAEGNVVLPK